MTQRKQHPSKKCSLLAFCIITGKFMSFTTTANHMRNQKTRVTNLKKRFSEKYIIHQM